MNLSIELTHEAKEDATLAVKWYDKQKEGLGDLFITYLNDTLENIKKYPAAYKKVHRLVRQAALQKFPYVILYKIDAQIITVHCIFHTSQSPGKKIKRLKK